MASPFRVFRRYQKALLVVAGVVLMFVFVIGDSLVPYLSGGGDVREGGLAPNATAVSWGGGKLTNAELDMLALRRRIIMEFLRMVEYSGRLAAFEAGNEPQPLRVEMLNLPERLEQFVEQDILRAKVLSQAAREAGMVVSDENIAQYLSELGRGNVSADDMRSLLERMQGAGRGVNIDFIFDGLREELLARNYLASYQFAMETVTPEQRWQDWLRVNDRVVVEAAAFPVEAFVVDVPEPTEKQVADFYNEYKDREPRPERIGTMELPSRLPGFKIPRKVDLKYIVASYDKFLENVAAKVTDEEVEKYYEEKKDPLFIKTDTGLFETESSETTAPPTGESEATETTETTESTDDTEATDAATEATESGNEGAAVPPSNEQDTDAVEESDAPATEESSHLERGAKRGVFQLAAFLQDAEETDSSTEASTDADANTETSDPSDAPAGTNAAETLPESGEPGTSDAAADPVASDTDATDTDASTTEAADKPLEFQPLEEVRDEIRRQIAEERVAEQLIQLTDELRGQLNEEFNKHFKASLDAESRGQPAPKPPAALDDLAALAAKHSLEAGQTGPMSLFELRDKHPLGRSVKADDEDESASREPLLELLLIDDLELYQPVVTVDIDGNRYVAMVVSDVEARVPKLADIRDQVVRAWKLQEAAVLAKKHAEDAAKRAQEAGISLSEFFADDSSVQVIKTDPFSELTGGAISRLTGQFQPFRLDEPDGIVAAGPEFMQTVFELEGDEVGAVLNHDHSIAYVVTVAEHRSTPEQLRQDYLAEANSWDGIMMMTYNRFQNARQVVVVDLLADAGVDWERLPDQPPPAEEE